MRSIRMGAAVFVISGAVGVGALAQADQSQSKGKEGQTSTSGQRDQSAQNQREKGDQAPDGFVLLEERVVVLTANEPQNHFLRAGDFWIEGNNNAAAAEMGQDKPQ